MLVIKYKNKSHNIKKKVTKKTNAEEA